MDVSSGLVRWAIRNRSNLDLQMIEYHWPRTWQFNYFDSQFSLFSGRYSGRGTSKDRTQAVSAGISEAWERFIQANSTFWDGLHPLQKTLAGTAAHTDPNVAKHKAYKEFRERLGFLSAWHWGGFIADELRDIELISMASKLFQKHGIALRAYRFRLPDNTLGTGVFADGRQARGTTPFGMIMGSASGHNSETAAALECLRNVIAWIEKPPSNTVIFPRSSPYSPHTLDWQRTQKRLPNSAARTFTLNALRSVELVPLSNNNAIETPLTVWAAVSHSITRELDALSDFSNPLALQGRFSA